MTKRNFQYDTMKGMLILLVLLGHCLEQFKGGEMIYRIIYSFHMPAFIFVSGYFAKYNAKRILSNFIVPYILFQTIYRYLDAAYFHPENEFTLQFTTPYWTLWYLLVMILFSITIPFITQEKTWLQIMTLLITVAISLFVGYDTTIGYYLALSRYFVFLPFFIWGYYSKNNSSFLPASNTSFQKVFLFILLVLSFSFICVNKNIPTKAFYGAYAYEKLGYQFQTRLIIMLIAVIGIFFLHAIIPDKKIPFITSLGQHTFPVYLMHSGCILAAKKIGLFQFSTIENIIITLGLMIAICSIFGNKYFDKLFRLLIIHPKK